MTGSGPETAISVIGGSTANNRELQWAQEVGQRIAQRGHLLICGGRGGVMEAACRGAQGEGGLTVGILPGSDRSGGNPFLTVAIPTGLGEARNVIVARAADAVIAIGGSYGTLSEMSFALKAGIPVVGLNTWTATSAAGNEIGLRRAATPEEAVELACASLDKM